MKSAQKVRVLAPKTPSVQTTTVDQIPAMPQEKTAQKKSWRLECKQLYLTFPQCRTSKEEALQNSIKKFGEELKWIVICEEAHKDGSPHLHASIALHERYRSRDQHDLDVLVVSSSHPSGKHGNYQATRNIKKNLEYVTKKGKYLVHGDLDLTAVLEKKGSVYQPIVEELLNGKTPEEIRIMYPCQYFLKRKEIHAFHLDVEMTKHQSEKPKIVNVRQEGPMNDTLMCLVTWLRENLLMLDLKKRKPRQKHLYLCGPPGIGKSRLLTQLREILRVYDIPAETWNDSYQDGIYDLMVFDEFQGQKAIGQLNGLTDGYTTPLIRRGTHPYLKNDKLPVIICSNKLPHDVYHNAKDRAYVDAFSSRYLVLDFYNDAIEKIDIKFDVDKPIESVLLPTDDEQEDEVTQSMKRKRDEDEVLLSSIRQPNNIDVDMSIYSSDDE